MRYQVNSKISYPRLTLISPHCHGTNTSKRALHIWKIQFKAGLATVNNDLRVCEWDCLISQRELTLNLLQVPHNNTTLLAWAYVLGTFDYNSIPVVPLGTHVLVYNKVANI